MPKKNPTANDKTPRSRVAALTNQAASTPPVATSAPTLEARRPRPSRVDAIRRPVALALLAVIGVVVIGLVVVQAGIVTKQWRSRVMMTVARVAHLPAVIVDGRWVPYDLYVSNVETLLYTYSQPEVLKANGLATAPTRADLEPVVLDRLVKDEITKREANQRGVVVDKTAIDQEMAKLTDQTGSTTDVVNSIKALYNWDLDTFRDRVVVPYLYRTRLQQSVAFDASINAAAEDRMKALLERVQSGKEDFAAIAKEVNEDTTKSSSGDLGTFARGERNATIEEATFGLEVGKTSGIVRTEEGFHILKLLERFPASPEKNEEERVHAAHIFLAAKSIDVWLFEQSSKHRVSVLMRGYRWDSSTAQITTK